MVEVRFAKKGEIIYQKHIWKNCFGDEDSYIDFYFSNKYKEDQAAVLLYNGRVAAMTTIIPGKMVIPGGNSLKLAMLYAVATDPKYQGMGFSTQIMKFCNEHLMGIGMDLSILVPAEESLFDFYSKRGYKDAFYMREIMLTSKEISTLKTDINQKLSIKPVEASEYNKRRRGLLSGNLYVDYNDEEIDYQKKVSREYGADLYGLDIGPVKGCAIAERIDQSKVFIKEILMPDGLIKDGLKRIAQVLPAEDYIIRLPVYQGEELGGIIKPFGMAKLYTDIPKQIISKVFQGELGYMGVAYD